ncbi:hypothetical protein HNP40_002638 [Mycobacteroides chelonae]|nr:hypothetical protein [Mycobacteroides chelonae]
MLSRALVIGTVFFGAPRSVHQPMFRAERSLLKCPSSGLSSGSGDPCSLPNDL